MKPKHILTFSITALIEGILVLFALMTITFTPGRGRIINYVTLRWILAGVLLLFLIALTIFVISMFSKPGWSASLSAWLDEQLVGARKRLFLVQAAFIILALLLGGCFLVTYLVFPEPARPLFLWAALTCLQAWLAFRLIYAREYRQRPSLFAKLRTKWAEWLPVQRKVSIVIAILGLLYFTAFIPVNFMRDQYGKFPIHADEEVLYPDVIRGMIFTNTTIPGIFNHILDGWSWQYGYPYFTVSAAVLLIPRLVFGDQFASQVQLNVFLLRQFVSVAPMVLALILAVYLVTRYKNMLASVSMFIFLAAVPGIVKYNHRFWHPDSLVVLLVVLTIYALQKDRLRFGRFFYLAAVFCGLAAATKLWGVFFGPVIAGYLLAGLFKKRLTVGKMFLTGSMFVLAMLAAILISSPPIMAPYVARFAVRSWFPMQGSLLSGYAPDTTGEYNFGLTNWLKYFGFHFMKGYFFYFSIFALVAGSLWGSKVTLNRILLGWCAVVAFFLAYFVALKNFQYMLPLAVPLYCGAFLFPAITEGNPDSKWRTFLARPVTRKIVWGITILMFSSQFIINLVILGLYATRGR